MALSPTHNSAGGTGGSGEVTPLLGTAVLPSLAAAGHASIFLHLFPRVAPRGEATLGLLRGGLTLETAPPPRPKVRGAQSVHQTASLQRPPLARERPLTHSPEADLRLTDTPPRP